MLIFLPNCATIYQPSQPFSDREIKSIITRMQEQEKKVFSFYSLGTILVKNGLWESEANILIVGIKNPFRIKIEMTHSWGQPILHILIDQSTLEILSFRDNKRYLGDFTPKALSKFIPGDLDSDLIWAMLRGYPALLNHDIIASSEDNLISLFNDQGKEVERINIHPDGLLPKEVFFPANFIRLAFMDFRESKGIFYAREVRVNDIVGKKAFILRNRKMVFNKTIPNQIFVMEKLPNFEDVSIEKAYESKGQ